MRGSLFWMSALPTISFASGLKTEFQKGDPQLQAESVSFNSEIVNVAKSGNRATYLDRITNFPDALVAECLKFTGKNRKNDQAGITRMLGLFDLPFEDKGKPLAFCAVGVSYVATLLYAKSTSPDKTEFSQSDLLKVLGDVYHHHFFPSPGVADMRTVGQVNRRWVPVKNSDGKFNTPKKGWLILFNWGGNQYHVGLVSSVNGSVIETIEFNTSEENQRDGGAIAVRHREISKSVIGFIDSSKTNKYS